MIKLKCGNMEKDNKYWLTSEKRLCMFCGKERDNFKHFIGKCRIAKDWFNCLGNEKEDKIRRLWNDKLDEDKERVLRYFWEEKEKVRKKRKVKEVTLGI